MRVHKNFLILKKVYINIPKEYSGANIRLNKESVQFYYFN